MNKLFGQAADKHYPFFTAAADIALKATCRQARCGSVVVSRGQIIGRGYNSPPGERETNRYCGKSYSGILKPKYDKTCCVHAEWRAILDACKRHADKIYGSTIYFMRLDNAHNFTDAGEPYCTTCSRLVMDAGIGRFALWHTDGVAIYTAEEYNRSSYRFFKPIRSITY